MKRPLSVLLGALATASLTLGGCTKDQSSDPAETADQPVQEVGVARATFDDEVFNFTLTTCVLEEEILRASGPGEAVSGEYGAWFDLEVETPSTEETGRVSVMLGTEKEGMDPDNSYRMIIGGQLDQSFSVQYSSDGGQVSIEGTASLADGPEIPAEVVLACGDWDLENAIEHTGE